LSERLAVPAYAALELHPQYRFQWEPKQNCFVLLFPEGLIQLPGSAGEIIKRVDGTRTADDIVKDLEASFPGVELKNDVIEFLEVAHGKGWIRAKANQ
jgi:pyrroloquinoline quinone biosynthesis protein D